MDEYGEDIITVIDDDGQEHEFELLDSIETDDAKYIAVIPSYDSAEEMLEDSGELIILKVNEDENGESILEPIEDDEEFDEIADTFKERLADVFDFEDEEDNSEEDSED